MTNTNCINRLNLESVDQLCVIKSWKVIKSVWSRDFSLESSSRSIISSNIVRCYLITSIKTNQIPLNSNKVDIGGANTWLRHSWRNTCCLFIEFRVRTFANSVVGSHLDVVCLAYSKRLDLILSSSYWRSKDKSIIKIDVVSNYIIISITYRWIPLNHNISCR